MVHKLVPGLPRPLSVSFPLNKSFLDLSCTRSGRHLFEVHHIVHHPRVIMLGRGTEHVVMPFQLNPRQQRYVGG